MKAYTAKQPISNAEPVKVMEVNVEYTIYGQETLISFGTNRKDACYEIQLHCDEKDLIALRDAIDHHIKLHYKKNDDNPTKFLVR